MSKRRVSRAETTWHTHAEIALVQTCAHTDTPTYSSPLSPLAPRLPFKAQAHTLDILPFFLAGASHGNSSRNPFSTDAGTAVLILNETQLVLPLSLHEAPDKNYMLLNSNLYCLLPTCTRLISSLSPPPNAGLNLFAEPKKKKKKMP